MKPLKYVLVFLLFSGTIYAQEAIVATGNNAIGASGSVSYSVGQIANSYQEGASGSINQGVQQPFEISVVLSTNDNFGINLTMVIYPNPTTDYLNLNIDQYNGEELTFQLYDLLGRVISQNQITNNSTRIDMSGLPTATYLLMVSSGNTSVKQFRIIKK
jgi:opacity protein-like surface antigen